MLKAFLLLFFGSLSLLNAVHAAGVKVFEYPFGRAIETVPAVDNDGTIFIGGKGAVAALTAAGVEKWKIELSPASQATIAGMTLGEDRVYVASQQGLYAFDKTGALIWTNGFGILNSKVALDRTNNLYIVDQSGVLRALRPDGSQMWSNSVEAAIPLSAVLDFGPIIGPDGRIFTTAGKIEAFSPSGEKLWTSAYAGQTQSPVIDEEGVIYLSSWDGLDGTFIRMYSTNGTDVGGSFHVRASVQAALAIGPDKTFYIPCVQTFTGLRGLLAFSEEGQPRWSFSEFYVRTSPAVAADGTIYASGEGMVVALSSSGSKLWTYTNGAPVVKGLNLGIDGSVLIAQENGTLLALSGTSPVADRVWPVYGRDSRQTSQQRISPILSILPVEEIATNSALFKAEINPKGAAATVFFEYSSTGSALTTEHQAITGTTETVRVFQSVAGLSAGTLYTVRLVSSNSGGISRSGVISFRTLGESVGDPPLLSSLEAAATGGGTVRFSGDGVIAINSPIEFRTNAVIEANGHRVVLTGNGQSSLLRVRSGVNLTLKGLWMADGKAPQELEAGNAFSRGGAIVNNGGDLTLIDCVFSNNVAHVVEPAAPGERGEAAGGAVWQPAGSLFAQNCQFISNRLTGVPAQGSFPGGFSFDWPTGRGGAICVDGGQAQIVDSVFAHNSGEVSGVKGGGIYFSGSALQIAGTVLTDNIAVGGGAIYMGAGTLDLTESTLARNTVYGTVSRMGSYPAFGAALFNEGTCLVEGSAFLTNQTIGGRGGGSFNLSPGPSAGAGIYNAGIIGVVNCTFSGNSSKSSINSVFFPGIVETKGEASAIASAGYAGITNSTIAWNKDALVAVLGETSTNLVLKNTLLAGGINDTTAGSFVDAGHNMSSDATPFTEASSRSNVNARLGPIGYYGGNTLVYPLMEGSPAIDGADDLAPPATDQRGRARPFGLRADIGAYESSPPFYIWGRIRGYHDPSTTLSFGTNSAAADTSGFFTVGPLPAGTNEISIAATNALFLPNPLVIDMRADQESDEVTSFQLHTLTYIGVFTTPPAGELGMFMLAGLSGEMWKVDRSTDLKTWTNAGVVTLNSSGLAEIHVPHEQAIFLKATPANEE